MYVYIYLSHGCLTSPTLENSLTQYTGVSVIPTQHKIIWAEISPRYLFSFFSEQTPKISECKTPLLLADSALFFEEVSKQGQYFHIHAT